MTLLVVNAQPDRASIMTDSSLYGPNGRILVTSPKAKATVLESINAAVSSTGNFRLGLAWEAAAERMAAEVADFDEFLAHAPALLRRITRGLPGALHAYMAGYSQAAGRYVAYVADTAAGYALEDVSDEMHVRPAPPGVQPTDVEARHWAALGKPLPDGERLDPPESVDGWAALAKVIHAGRACAPMERKVFMHGDVTLTRLHDGQVTQETVHTFTGADLRAMVAGTFHPFGQLAPCSCGSARRFLDCCIPKFEHLDCLCGTGRPMGECCKLGADGHEELLRLIRTVLDPDGTTDLAPTGDGATPETTGRNDPCPCGSGAKHKRCCALVAA